MNLPSPLANQERIITKKSQRGRNWTRKTTLRGSLLQAILHNEVKITADLPGLEEKDIELALQDGVLTLKGEKKSESEGALYSERWHGQFQRSVQLGPEVDPDNVKAAFKNGVLTVALAKKPEAQTRVKRIPIGS
jgi:HSP20 family molecular chaperone IbpA